MLFKKLAILFLGVSLFNSFGYSQDAKQIIARADDKMQGKSNKSQMTMTIVRPTYSRSIEFKNWSLGRDFFITYVISPAKDKGQVFLKVKNELWNFMPTINRTVKLPPSVMSQGWMGSDYSNDDLVKQSSIVNDYTHNIVGTQKLLDHDCYVIEMIPLPGTTVVWGKIMVWVDKTNEIIIKGEYYDDQMELVRTEDVVELKTFNNKLLPSIIEIIPKGEEGNKTIIKIEDMQFDIDIKESFFTLQNMKVVR